MHSTNLFTIVNASYRNELRAKFLADAIPATSFAAGANHTDGLKDNHNMQSQTPNGWPEQRSEDDDFVGVVHKWYHSDIKNVSFYYIHKVFEKITKEN